MNVGLGPSYHSRTLGARYSPRITRAVSGIVPSIRFLRSFSSAFYPHEGNVTLSVGSLPCNISVGKLEFRFRLLSSG